MPWITIPPNVVITAQHFNPSIASQLWLARNEVVHEAEFNATGSFFSEMIVQVNARPFRMLLVPEQLQFAPLVDPAGEQALISERLGKLVGRLPETPYKAIGLNIIWHLIPRDGNMQRLTRELFYRDDRSVCRYFDTPEAHFGAYYSKDVNGFRLKLDVKPVILANPEEQQRARVQFAFNFHKDLTTNPVEEIQDRLRQWDWAREEAQRVIDAVESQE